MAQGDKLAVYREPNSIYNRVKRIERADKGKVGKGGGRTITPPDQGTSNVPVVHVEDVAATVVPEFTASGEYKPFIRVVVNGDYPTVRSFLGYTVRVTPAIGAAFPVEGPTYPDTPSPIDIKNLPTPPLTQETWKIRVRVRTAMWGDGFWSDEIPVSWGQDLIAPEWTGAAWPLDWKVSNVFDESAGVTRLVVKWNALTGATDLDRYQLRLGYVSGGVPTWQPQVPKAPNELQHEFTNLTPGATVRVEILAQDTSGNQGAWHGTSPQDITVAGVPQPPVPTDLFIYSWSIEGLNAGTVTLRWNQGVVSTAYPLTPVAVEIQYLPYGKPGNPVQSGRIPITASTQSYDIHGIPFGAWQFQIRSISASGRASDWSAVNTSLDVITFSGPNTPTGLAVKTPTAQYNVYNPLTGNTDITFVWNAVSGAEGYYLEVSVNGTTRIFKTAALLFLLTAIPGSSLSVAVRSYDSFNNKSPASPVVSCLACVRPAGTTIVNGDFEGQGATQTDAYGWTVTANPAPAPNPASTGQRVSTNTPYAGAWHMMLDNYSNGDAGSVSVLSDKFSVTPGVQYTLGFNAKTTSSGAPGVSRFNADVVWYNSSGTQILVTTQQWYITSTYDHYAIVSTAPAGAAFAAINFVNAAGVGINAQSNMRLFVDAVTFEGAVTGGQLRSKAVGGGNLDDNLNYASNLGLGVTPTSKLDVGGWRRFQSNNAPPSGSADALEVFYYTAGAYGGLLAYNRGTNSYLPMQLQASSIVLAINGHATIATSDSGTTFSNNGTAGGSHALNFWHLPSTGTAVPVGQFVTEFADATRATWKGRSRLTVQSYNGTHEALRLESSGFAARIGFFGAAAVDRQTGGAATAGASYTSNEQTMLNRVYTRMRNYGLIT